MPLSRDQLGQWGNRVRFAPGPEGFAYRPGVFFTPDSPAVNAVVERTLGNRATTDVPGEPDEGDQPRAPAIIAGFKRWRFAGDVLRAVQQLRGVGVEDAQPVHVFFADQAPRDKGDGGFRANPVYANPVYANPVYANPVYANPVYANPVYANPVYANPVYANPVYANPVYANPVYANPVYANPVYANPGPGSTIVANAPVRSRVYPNPVYAESHMEPEAAARYRASGARPSQARPDGTTIGLPGDLFGVTPEWDAAPVRVLVLDTGLDVGLRGNVGGGIELSDLDDLPDQDGDNYLDPVACHGTFIAGLIRRVAPGAAVHVKQVLSSFGDGGEDEIMHALELAAALPCPPHIVSLSLSGYTLDDPAAFRSALTCVGLSRAVVVASAGNDGTDRVAYPAGFDGVIAVGALGPDGPAPFSNHGDWVNACAPGVDLTSSFLTRNFGADGKFNFDPDRYHGRAVWSGTSFAAPIVAATLARTMGEAPGMSAADAASVVVDQAGLWRIPGYGTVVNVLGARPELVW